MTLTQEQKQKEIKEVTETLRNYYKNDREKLAKFDRRAKEDEKLPIDEHHEKLVNNPLVKHIIGYIKHTKGENK